MDRKTLTIVLAVALIVAFFLPFYKVGSGFDYVKAGGDWENYLPLVFPISGAMLLVGSLNNGNYPGGRSLWTWLPFLAVLFILIINPLIQGGDIGKIFKAIGSMMGVGGWITIISSIVLAFYNPRS